MNENETSPPAEPSRYFIQPIFFQVDFQFDWRRVIAVTPYTQRVPEPLPKLTIDFLKRTAQEYGADLNSAPIPELFGVTDGKAVGTYVEVAFNRYIAKRFTHDRGNAAKGIDFPELNVDLKVTSVKQPQSSSPFRDASQKVYGLGYHLLVFVYEKVDDLVLSQANLIVRHVVFVDQGLTGDFQTTSGIAKLLDADANVDDLDGFLEEKNLPLDEIGRRLLAERILLERPSVGCLTISNALQWRLQYGRAITLSADPSLEGVEDLRG
jgi:hypothetical protein